jgi:uncharacterized protein (DUF983 family)
MECKECGGNCLYDEFFKVYTCENCGQKYYFKEDFDGKA